MVDGENILSLVSSLGNGVFVTAGMSWCDTVQPIFDSVGCMSENVQCIKRGVFTLICRQCFLKVHKVL